MGNLFVNMKSFVSFILVLSVIAGNTYASKQPCLGSQCGAGTKSLRSLDLESARRRELLKMPKKMCAPAASAGTFIIEQAMDCARKMLMQGASKYVAKLGKAATLAMKVGTKAAKKLDIIKFIK